MIGAVLLLCGLLGVFYWWLINNYDEEDSRNAISKTDITRCGSGGRRRHRGKNKKGKQKGKATPVQPPTLAAEATTSNEQRPSNRKGPANQGLDAQEWPTLGRAAQEEEEEEEEDLAALHAEMLKNAKSAAPVSASPAGVRNSHQSKDKVGVGDRVEGRFEAGTEWFPAIVTKTLHGGLVNLLYDDGERETRVPLSLVRQRGAPAAVSSGSDSGSDSESSEEEAEARAAPAASTRENTKQGDGWEVIVQKPKKTRVERIESRVEANSNLKNRLKRQKKREKEIAAREALRKKL